MMLENFLERINRSSPYTLAESYLYDENVEVFKNAIKYKKYIELIKQDYPSALHIAIMGSGNWCYSLNPRKSFTSFHESSDIDVAIICPESFYRVWEDLRSFHRNNYYLIPHHEKDRLRRNGENVYSGFISPKWIPEKNTKSLFEYEVNINTYSNSDVGYRQVNMMYFKNTEEAVDYYVRGFTIAKKK
jgi:predicted nucleotidyltransferase